MASQLTRRWRGWQTLKNRSNKQTRNLRAKVRADADQKQLQILDSNIEWFQADAANCISHLCSRESVAGRKGSIY